MSILFGQKRHALSRAMDYLFMEMLIFIKVSRGPLISTKNLLLFFLLGRGEGDEGGVGWGGEGLEI